MSVSREEVKKVIRTDVNSIVTAWQVKYGISLPMEAKLTLVEAMSAMFEAGVEGMLTAIGASDDSEKSH